VFPTEIEREAAIEPNKATMHSSCCLVHIETCQLGSDEWRTQDFFLCGDIFLMNKIIKLIKYKKKK
jgi:hypothetical protein